MNLKEIALSLLHSRKQAYIQTFDKEDKSNLLVLADLARFCRADRTTFHPDPRVHAVLEGRREVFLRIQQHLNLDTDELSRIYITKEK